MMKTPLFDRVERWLTCEPSLDKILLHPDDYEQLPKALPGSFEKAGVYYYDGLPIKCMGEEV